MGDKAMELTGRAMRGSEARREDCSVRCVGVPSRLVRRQEAIWRILDAAYRRDLCGRREPGVDL